MTALRTLALSLLLAGAAISLRTLPGAASCAGLPVPVAQAIGSAPTVFVGTVTGTADNDRTATVHVDEVWNGPALPAEVTLHGSPDTSAAATSVDRHYNSGRQYLFVPEGGAGSDFSDNSCSQTAEFDGGLRALRPSSVRRYPAAPPRPPWLGILTVGAVAAGGLTLAVWHRRRSSG